MDKSGNDFAFVIQEFLDLKSRQESSSKPCLDECLIAFEVSLVQSWVDLPRILALIRNESNQQTVLFIFVGSRIGDTVVSYLTPEKILAVDEILRYETDSKNPAILRIIGHDITSSKSDFDLPCSTLPHSINQIPSTLQKRHTVFAGNESVLSSAAKTRHCNLVLGFDDATSANQFRTQLAIILSQHSNGSSPSIAKIKENRQWLNKYRADIEPKRVARLSNFTSNTTAATSASSHRESHHLHIARSSVDFNGANKQLASVSSAISSHSSSLSSSSISSISTPSTTNIPSEIESEVPGKAGVHDLAETRFHRSLSVPGFIEVEENLVGKKEARSSVVEVEQGEDVVEHDDWVTGDLGTTESLIPKATVPTSVEHKTSSEGSNEDMHPSEGIKSRESTAISFMPDALFRSRMNGDPVVKSMLEEDETAYCSWKTLNLFIGSWNVNGRQDPLLNLDDWIRPPKGEAPADIYIFGFQELDLNLAGMALNKQSPSPFEGKWLFLLEASLEALLNSRPVALQSRWAKRTGGGFNRKATVRLAGLLLVVYVSNRLQSHAVVSDISLQSVPTGMFNLMGNKGSVGVHLTVYNHTICLLNCHLAAGTANCERRNQDYGEIARKMIFERRSPNESPQYIRINDHDQVFLFGDLNYRIAGLEVGENLEAISRGDYSLLLKHDELLTQQSLGQTLQGYREGNIAFAPTYKFDLAANSYVTVDGRAPSYCDRILWKGKYVEQISYRSHEVFRLSDHKPVSAYFKIGARCVNPRLFTRAYEAGIRCQDLYYNMLLPQATLSTQEVDFGPVFFEDIRQATINLTNTGHASLEFTFSQEGAAAFPPWLHVAPPKARIERGESCDIQLDVCVSPDVVSSVQSGAVPLSCIIVLTLVGGKDFFVSITGRFVPTSFGLPLTLLLKLPTSPVALINPEKLTQMVRESRMGNWSEGELSVLANSGKSAFVVPKEIYRLADFIIARVEEPELFRQPEQRSDLAVIRDTLDTTKHDVTIPPSVSVHSVIYSLLVFLSALPEPVIPFAFQGQCFAAARQLSVSITPTGTSNGNVMAVYQAIARLPIDHQNLFFYLVSFIKRCLTFSSTNGTNVDMLASTFADLMLRDPPYISTSPKSQPFQQDSSTRRSQQQLAQNRQELKTVFLKTFITSDTEEVIRRLKQI
nr:inositol polyphosphate 5 phosphatase OCRL 1 [Hymenolepis microstoma]